MTVTTWVCWQALVAAFRSRGVVATPAFGLLVLVWAAGLGFGAVNEVVEFDGMNPAHFEPAARNEDHFHSAGDLSASFGEVNFGISDREMSAEVERCMNCGVCNRCELCLIFCPDMAIHRREDGEGFEIDLRYCKGCGLCAAECPRGAMAMSREES